MMKRVLFPVFRLAVLAGTMTICGCSLFSPPEQAAIEYYDLIRPAKIASVPIDVDQFVNFSGERQRMVRRKTETVVRCSDFHKWIQAPGSMLTRYLRIAFRNEEGEDIRKNTDPVTVRGEVLVFEVNEDFAELGVRYQLRRGSQSLSKTVLLREKLESRTPDALADAMSRAANRFARMIADEAGKFAGKRP